MVFLVLHHPTQEYLLQGELELQWLVEELGVFRLRLPPDLEQCRRLVSLLILEVS